MTYGAGQGSELEAVKQAVSVLVLTERTVRTYPIGNQLSQNALAELLPSLSQVLPLELRVDRDQLLWNGETLLDSQRDRSEMPARLYRDGVRTLRLEAGIDAPELQRFIVALATPIHPEDLSEDYVTLLWAAELPNVQIVAVDPYIDLDVPEEVLEGQEKPSGEVEDVGLPADGGSVPAPPDEAFILTAEDRERLEHDVHAAEANPPWSSFISALFDLLNDRDQLARTDEIVSLLEAAFVRTLRDSLVDVASEILLRIQGHTPPHAELAMRAAMARMGHPDRLIPLHEALESGNCDRDAAERALVLLGDRVPEAPCALLALAKGERVRRFYVDVLVKIGLATVEPVLQHLQTAHPEAQLHFARVLSQLRDPRASAALVALSRSGASDLRKEALRGMIATGEGQARAVLLRSAVDDPDASVRIVALRCLGHARATLDCGKLIERLRDAASLSAEERELLYTAIGSSDRSESAEFLAGLLSSRWLRGRSDLATWKLAAGALARMTLPAARAALEAGARSRTRELARVCRETLENLERNG